MGSWIIEAKSKEAKPKLVYIYICVCKDISICIYTCVHLSTCMYVYIYIHTYLSMISIHIYIYIYLFIYLYTPKKNDIRFYQTSAEFQTSPTPTSRFSVFGTGHLKGIEDAMIQARMMWRQPGDRWGAGTVGLVFVGIGLPGFASEPLMADGPGNLQRFRRFGG